jgi:D-sedoheptulose 7-phosphate isomerase
MNNSSLIELYKIESSNVVLNMSTKKVEEFVTLVIEAYNSEKKIFACGNGGNAAFVGNLVVDLNMHPFVSEDKSSHGGERNRFHAINLCEGAATITGITNDLGFNSIFKEQLKYQAEKDDILFCISGSGNSGNIIEAMKYAKNIGMKSVIITRNSPCKADELADVLIEIKGISEFPGQTGNNNNNFHFEDCISKITHITTGILKLKVTKDNQSK